MANHTILSIIVCSSNPRHKLCLGHPILHDEIKNDSTFASEKLLYNNRDYEKNLFHNTPGSNWHSHTIFFAFFLSLVLPVSSRYTFSVINSNGGGWFSIYCSILNSRRVNEDEIRSRGIHYIR